MMTLMMSVQPEGPHYSPVRHLLPSKELEKKRRCRWRALKSSNSCLVRAMLRLTSQREVLFENKNIALKPEQRTNEAVLAKTVADRTKLVWTKKQNKTKQTPDICIMSQTIALATIKQYASD